MACGAAAIALVSPMCVSLSGARMASDAAAGAVPRPSPQSNAPAAGEHTAEAYAGASGSLPKNWDPLYGPPAYRPNWDPRPHQNDDYAHLHRTTKHRELPGYLRHARCLCTAQFDAWWKCVRTHNVTGRSNVPQAPCWGQDMELRVCVGDATAHVRGPQLPESDWRENIAPDGRRYYFNPKTRISTPQQPPEWRAFDQYVFSRLQINYRHVLSQCDAEKKDDVLR